MNDLHPTIWVVLGAMLMATGPVPVRALEVSVRGEAELQTDVRAAGTTVEVEGRLLDDLGEAIPRQSVAITVYEEDGETAAIRELHTDYHGLFSAVFELAPGTYRAEVEYGGASHVTDVHGEESFEVRDAPPHLAIDAPRWTHGETSEVPVRVRATADGVGIPTFVTLKVDDRPVASVDLDADGRGRFDVGPFLEAGDNRVAIVLEATEHREATGAEATVRRIEELTVKGDVERVFERTARGRRLEVVVEEQRGPVADAEVELGLVSVGDTERERTERDFTDESGRAGALFPDEVLVGESWRPRARIEPPAGEAVVWEGDPFEHRAPIWPDIVRGIAVVVLLVGVGWLGRRGVSEAWRRLARRWSDQDDGADETAAGRSVLEETEDVELQPVETETPSEPGARGPTSVTVAVWDVWNDEPVTDATVVLETDGGERRRRTGDGAGRIEIPLENSPVRIRAEAPGFVPGRTTIEPPIAPAVRLEMTAVPLKIRRAYRWMIETTRGEDPWGRLTPRQIEEALSSRLPDPGPTAEETDLDVREWRRLLEDWDELGDDRRATTLVEVLTAVVEETNYSGRVFEVSVWERVRGLLEELVDRLEDRQGGDR